MHRRGSVPKLDRRRDEMILTLMYKYSKMDAFLDDYRGERVTRSDRKIKFAVKRARLTGYQKSPLFRGAALWDLLGEYYQKSINKSHFKQRIGRLENLHIVNKDPENADDLSSDSDEDEDTSLVLIPE